MEISNLQLNKSTANQSVAFFVGMLGLAMNQSNVMFGFNLSIADFMIMFLLVLLVINQMLEFPTKILTVFLFFSFFLLVNSTLIIPSLNGLRVDMSFVLKDYLKLLVSLLYFCIGMNIARLELTPKLLKGFLLFAVFTGGVGIVVLLTNIPALSNLMLYGHTRLTGFMNDPNYFAVIQCCALAFLLRTKVKIPWLKWGGIVILVLSIFGSASKTGFITLGTFLLFRLWNMVREEKLKGKNLFYALLVLAGLVVMLPFIGSMFVSMMGAIAERFPIFTRVQMLTTDLEEAISGGGSARNTQWYLGMELIQNHPLNGVGIGQNYIMLASRIMPSPNIAHNTYIQMAADWGLPVTTFLFLYIAGVYLAPVEKERNQMVVTLKEMFFCFLIGSMAISFNYSRIFWLLLGLLAYSTFPRDSKERK